MCGIHTSVKRVPGARPPVGVRPRPEGPGRPRQANGPGRESSGVPRVGRPPLLLVALVAGLLLAGGVPILGAARTATPAPARGLELRSAAPRASLPEPPLAPRRGLAARSAYTSEPAPVGVADYGTGPSGDILYNATSFEGSATLEYLSARNASLGGKENDLTFQLNLNLVFESRGASYTYWVQNVAYYDSSTGNVSMFDNIWNSSSSAGTLYPSSVAGGGSVQGSPSGSFYFDAAAATLPGNGVDLLPFGTELDLFTNATLSGNDTPEVTFSYEDGAGFQTYDTVSFPFARQPASGPDFLVDGAADTPVGNYYDAEFVLGGPGGGSSTALAGGSAYVTLQYWNGHNYEVVPNSSNYGSDTAETVSNASALSTFFSADGQMAVWVTSGAGGLGENWASDQLAGISVNVGANLPGQVLENNFSVAFVGGYATFLLWPGSYALVVDLYGTVESCGSYDLAANTSTQAICPGTYAVSFQEQGLLPGTSWSVQIGSILQVSSTTSLTFAEPDGSYTYVLEPVPGYTTPSYGGNLTVQGGSFPVRVVWTAFLWNVTWEVVGLGAHPSWEVAVTNLTASGAGAGEHWVNASQLRLALPNGSYDYVVAAVPGYTSRNGSGEILVDGAAVTVSVPFVPYLFAVSFREVGLPGGTLWNVTLGNLSKAGSGPLLIFSVANGSLAFVVAAVDGLLPDPADGTLDVAGMPVNLTVRFGAPAASSSPPALALLWGWPGLVLVAALAGGAAGWALRRRAPPRPGPPPAGPGIGP